MARAARLKAPLGLVDAISKAMAVEESGAPLSVDRQGNPVTAGGWKITERVPHSEDLHEHMAREVVPFSEDVVWDPDKAREGTEIPFTRIFYRPTAPRPLAEIDADVQRIMSELAAMFANVSQE
jgi:type I restriction enzyme M protein